MALFAVGIVGVVIYWVWFHRMKRREEGSLPGDDLVGVVALGENPGEKEGDSKAQ